ncbi:DUF4190 domain-containing protein [Paraliobacillus salinarum]|uniref:DUF4190 domain-containing protein n=1 Tax=Paraliobacillus salinarum TaxID=1158996 RepID=UPI001FEA73F0|nr:DUF4190 domain-containing protein [Paraliobacillus salinarum]
MEEQQFKQVPQTCGKATASMVLGILAIIIPWIGFILGIIAIVLANKAFKEISQHQLGGRGMAVAGLTTGIVATTFYGLLILFGILGFAFFAV